MTKNKLYNQIVSINKRFGGQVVRPSSLEFATSYTKGMNPYKVMAHVNRAIIVDHPFTDYNKRTATIVTAGLFRKNNIKFNKIGLMKSVRNIARTNETSIRKIEGRLRKCSQKKN